ncbi:hypothetical protein HK405_013312, partial [Cladochytrium tenue]
CTYSLNDPFNGCNKTLDLLGGDYGDSGLDMALYIGNMTMVAGINPNISALESASHPNTATTFNYWFVKFNWANDFDISAFTAMEIDLIAPSGSDFNVTLTQWIPQTAGVRDGNGTRGIDSAYHLLSSYLTPDGTEQTLLLPLSDYATNLDGAAYDLTNVKDLTLVNLEPVNATFVFTRITLVGNCSSSSSSSAATGTKTGSSATASATSKSTTGAAPAGPAAAWVGVAVALLAALVTTAL